MSRVLFFLLLTSFYCLGLHCKREDEEGKLPPATSIGAGTFGCLLNGKAWPKGAKGELIIEVYYGNGVLSVSNATRLDPFSISTDESVYFRTNKIHQPGDYYIGYNDINADVFSVVRNGTYYSSTFSNKDGWAHLIISRLDSTLHIVSGTFEFSLNDGSGSSKMKVSSGRFDYRYW